ncbi:VCBS repeat-containing protein [Sediminibacterium sp. WSJ-3]|nr:VCBS repeat-containing protein [Sediminibacterium soli]
MEHTGISFTNTVQNTRDQNIFSFRNFYNGGGAGIGDINNDGLADVFFTANMGSNKLFLNKGNWKFEDISAKAGFTPKEKWSTGVVMVDINNDGWLDIYVCNSAHINDGVSRENELYINNHDLTFTESAKEYGLADSGYSTQASFFDYDMDGDLDCFIVNNSPIPVNTLNYANKRDLPAAQWPIAPYLRGGGDHLYRNDNGRFKEVSSEAGIHGSLISFGLGVTVGDVNGDNYPDVYVSNDFFERDYLYINQRNGTFKDELENWMQHTSLASMGADIADVNNDGYPDIFTTDMLADDDYRLKTTSAFDNIDVYKLKENTGFYHQYQQNTLQINNRHGKFMDAAYFSGVAASDWSWGGLMFDADNDGLTDLYICNGITHDLTNQDFIDFFANDIVQKTALSGKMREVDSVINKMPSVPLLNKAFRNTGNLHFTDEGKNWGFTQPSFSNGAAYGDLDNDGDLDMVVNNVNQPAFIYRNNSRETTPQHYVSVSLKGLPGNTFAIGSSIKVYTGKEVLSRELMPSRGFQSSMDYKTVIGLGAQTKIDSLVVIWPNRTYSTYDHPAIDTLHVLQQPAQAKKIGEPAPFTAQPLLMPVKSNFEKHTEDDYIDFYTERNIPEMLSREGPRCAVGDVNGDGLDDVFIGGTVKHPGQLYLQTAGNAFVKKVQPVFDRFVDFEDVAVLFFDADGDKDLDLFVGAGGNNASFGDRIFAHRLLLNDGKGNFRVADNAFPANSVNIGVAVASDFDRDGDLDLFVGGRSVPGEYGVTPSSYLYVNDGKGHFTDIAAERNPDIAKIGMVTGAAWVDIQGDREKELVIAGQWMGVRAFAYSGGKFAEVKTNLSSMHGWWQTLQAADLDGDGDEDLVLGNIGENFYLRPDAQNPVKIWVSDFDQNNINDKILTRAIDGKDMPVFLKRDLEEQVPALKKKNLRHETFATKPVQELFTEEQLKKASVKDFTYSASCVALNNRNGQFTVQKLPLIQQLSSVNAIRCMDVNNDGRTDLVLGGNKFTFMPQLGRLDAGYGAVLLNDGKAGFTAMEPNASGLELRAELKDIGLINTPGKRYLLFLQNNQLPVLMELQKNGKGK